PGTAGPAAPALRTGTAEVDDSLAAGGVGQAYVDRADAGRHLERHFEVGRLRALVRTEPQLDAFGHADSPAAPADTVDTPGDAPSSSSLSASNSSVRPGRARTQPRAPMSGSFASSTTTWIKVSCALTVTSTEAPRFSATVTSPSTASSSGAGVDGDQDRYSGRAPQMTFCPSATAPAVSGGRESDVPASDTRPPSTTAGCRFIGVEPTNPATNVFAGRANTSRGLPTC